MPYVADLSLFHEVTEEQIVDACRPETILVVDNRDAPNSFVANFLYNIHAKTNLDSRITDFARLFIYSGFEVEPQPHPFLQFGEDFITLDDWRKFAAKGQGYDVFRAAVLRCANCQVGFSSYGLFDQLEDTVAMVARGDGREKSSAARLMGHIGRGYLGPGNFDYEFFHPILVVYDMMQVKDLPQDEQEQMLRDLAPAVMWARRTPNVYTKVCVPQQWGDFFEGELQKAGEKFGVTASNWRVVKMVRDPRAEDKKLQDLFHCWGRHYTDSVILIGRPAGIEFKDDPDYIVAYNKANHTKAVFSFVPLPPPPEGKKRPGNHENSPHIVLPHTGDAAKDLRTMYDALDKFANP